jgi:hypothetical protein
MVDTVRVEYFGKWRAETPDGWSKRESRQTANGEDGKPIEKQGRMMVHQGTDFRIGGDTEYATWVEVSLPKLLFGNNGIMIRTQAQLDEAVRKAMALAAVVSEPMLQGINPRCTRLDLVAQFLIEPSDFMLAHRETNHPRIRGRKSHYEGESLHFVGKERHCRIYDKVKEMQGKPGHVTRVEWQLRGNALRHDMRRDFVAFCHLSIEDCYDAYRRLCMEFEPRSLPACSDLYDLLAAGIRDGATVGGVPLFDSWARGKHSKTVRRVRREIAKRRAEVFKIDWKKMLPDDFGAFSMVDYHAPAPF